jgi:hypothetical protein
LPMAGPFLFGTVPTSCHMRAKHEELIFAH